MLFFGGWWLGIVTEWFALFLIVMVLIYIYIFLCVFFFSSRRRHTRYIGDWSSDVCSSDLTGLRSRKLAVVVGLLVALGVAASTGRALFRSDWVAKNEPLRTRALERLGIVDPFASDRAAEVWRFDGNFRDNPRMTLVHILPGAFFLLFGFLQFSSRIRARWIVFHRWSGRVLIAAAWVLIVPALLFGVLTPYGGTGEAIAIALFGVLFVVFLAMGFAAIRRGDVTRHRAWMTRAFAIAVGVSVERVLFGPLDLLLTPAGFRPPAIFVISIWMAWIVTAGVAELWIRTTPRIVDAQRPATV